MAQVRQFEDLIAWQRARELAVSVYRLTTEAGMRDRILEDQLRRAGLSVPSNGAEGFERGSRAEFHRFLSIAKGSCGELQSHLYIAEDLNALPADRVRELRGRARELSRIIGALRSTVGRHRALERKKKK